MKHNVSLICNTWPEGAPVFAELQRLLGENFKLHKGLVEGVDLIVYVRIPWNQLLKQCLKATPEFKGNDVARKELKQMLSATERSLDLTVSELENKERVLILDEDYFRSEGTIEISAELIRRSIRGK